MTKLAIELCLEKTADIVSGLETLTNLPSVKITADEINQIKAQIDDIEISQLTDMSTSFLANERIKIFISKFLGLNMKDFSR